MKGAHDILMWLDGWLFGHRRHIDTGWQRTPAQNTDSLRLPNLLDGIAGGPAWTGATGTRTAAYRQEHQRGHTPIPPTRDTPGEIPVSRSAPVSVRRIHEMAELSRLPTAPALKEQPEWLHSLVPNGQSLPVLRQQAAPALPNEEQLDAMLQTMRANSRPLPPGFSDPSVVADLPTEKQTQEQADAWLNDVPAPSVEIWEEYAPPVLAPLSEQSLSVSDRVAISNAFGVTEEDCEPDLTDEDDTDATKASALLKLRFCEHKKESE